MKDNNKGIVILGHPRSGTTLTRRLLNNHSRIACPPETHLFSACARFLESERTAAGLDIGVLAGLSFIGCEDENIINRLREFAFSFLTDFARENSKHRWAEKTAFDAFHINYIEQFCADEVQYIGIVRHPLDVAMSTINFCESMGFYPRDLHKYIREYSHPLEAFVHSWLDVSSSLVSLAAKSENMCRIFRYEDLISSTQNTMTDLLAFLGEDYENGILDNLTTEKEVGFGDHKGYQRKNIDNESVGRWFNLPQYQIAEFAPKLNPMLSQLGYDLLDIPGEISVSHARKQYVKGIEFIAKRGAEKSDVSVKHSSEERSANPKINKKVSLPSLTYNKMHDCKVDVHIIILIAFITLIRRAIENREILINIDSVGNKSIKLPIIVDETDTFEDIIQKCNETDMEHFKASHLIFGNTDLRLFLNKKVIDIPILMTVERQRDARIELIFEFENLDHSTQYLCSPIINRYLLLIDAVLENMGQKIGRVPLLSPEEEKILFANFRSFSSVTLSTIQQFCNQVELYPEHKAISFENNYYSYSELFDRVTKLSDVMRKRGVSASSIVAIYLDRSLDLVTSLLAVMHAGGTYVPIDPSHPSTRISQILEDAEPQLILTVKQKTIELTSEFHNTTYCLDTENWNNVTPKQLSPYKNGEIAYIIFTSGSTGRPKGVEVKHHGLSTFLRAMSEQPGLVQKDSLLSVTTISFDIAGLEIYLPLIVVATVFLASKQETIDGKALQDLMVKNNISCLQATPATYRLLLSNGWSGSSQLKLLCGGESLSRKLANELLPRCYELWNMYGPTETTIWSTVKKIDHADSITIGHPIRGTRTYVLNSELLPVSLGVAGELFIGGDGVAKGYHKQEDLTEKSFLPDIYADSPNSIMYRTGDLARVLESGEIICLGRLDNQVKIRGYRIELGDIETIIGKLENVEQCVVGVNELPNENKSLVAYIIMKEEAIPLTIIDLRGYLIEHLPEYMIPVFVVILDSFPLTPNNKIDRKLLPAPHTFNSETNQNDNVLDISNKEAARKIETKFTTNSNLEIKILESWKKIFNVRSISANDSFIGLGGDSLTYVQITISLEELLGSVPVNWEELSISELSECLEETPSNFVEMDVSIFIRAIAIIFVVFNHANSALGMNGATHGLFMVAGLLFAKFQFELVKAENSVIPIFKSIIRILVPGTLYMGALLFLKQEYRPDVLLLYSNFTQPIGTYWFIQALIQILVLFAVIFAIKPLKKHAQSEPYKSGVVLLGFAACLMALSPLIAPDNLKLQQLPTVRLWQFVLGWCLFFAHSRYEKILLAHFLCALCLLEFLFVHPDKGLDSAVVPIFIGIILLTYDRMIVIKPINQLVYNVAAASLFIFLSHRQFFSLLDRMGIEVWTLKMVAGLLGGYVMWWLWEFFVRTINKLTNR